MFPLRWAFIAQEAEELIETIAAEVAKEKAEKNRVAAQAQHESGLVKSLTNPPEMPDANAAKTDAKLAEIFPTNRTYINQALKIVALFVVKCAEWAYCALSQNSLHFWTFALFCGRFVARG